MKKLLLIATTLSIIASCNKVTELESSGSDVAASFVSTTITRATDEVWAANDKIGIFAYNDGAIYNSYENIPYITINGGSSASFTPSGTTIYYPSGSSALSFIAYSPYQESADDGVYEIDLSAQNTPEAIDLIVANDGTEYSNTNPEASLQLDHKLAKLTITLAAGNNLQASDLEGATIKITNIATDGTYNFEDGTFGYGSADQTITPRTLTADSKYEAIILPYTVATFDVEFTLTNGKTYTWDLNGESFTSGKDHAYTVTIAESTISISSATLSGWGTTESEDLVADKVTSTFVFSIEAGYFEEESDVNNVDVYLFDSSSELWVRTFSLQDSDLANDTDDENQIVYYKSELFDIDPGTYNIFAVANSSSVHDVTTQEQLLEYEDNTYKSNNLMSSFPDAGFIMTNRGSENQAVTIVADEHKAIKIALERAFVKISITQGKDYFSLTNSDGGTYAAIRLQNYMMVNLATSYYLFRHTANLATFTAPTYSYPLNYGDLSGTDGYVVDLYFFSKSASTIGAFTNSDGFFSQQLQSVVTDPKWSMMPTSPEPAISFCLENTIYKDAQLNGYTTGVIFEAMVIPSSVIIDYLGTTTITLPYEIYYYDCKFYNSVATLKNYLGSDAPEGDYSDDSSTKELEDVGIIRLTLTNGNYPCYYNYWIKHLDNNDANAMGAMEFGIVRNNHYQISISSITDLGTGKPTLYNDQADETEEPLVVNLSVTSY